MTRLFNILRCTLPGQALLLCCTWLGAAVFVTSPALIRAGELNPLYPGYPEVFDKQGILQSVQQDQLVVNDATMKIPAGATFNTPKGSVGQTGIPLGSRVGVLLTKENEVESVWFLAAGESASAQNTEKDKTNSGGPMKFENGMWTN